MGPGCICMVLGCICIVLGGAVIGIVGGCIDIPPYIAYGCMLVVGAGVLVLVDATLVVVVDFDASESAFALVSADLGPMLCAILLRTILF